LGWATSRTSSPGRLRVGEDQEDQRRKWVEDYNKSLTNYYIGGIYDSEYMNYVYQGIETKKIKEDKKNC
jgi:hypothetical protein